MKEAKKQSIIFAIVVIMIGLMFAGGTYAFLSTTVNTTNQVYNTTSLCFLIDYNINNQDNTQDITGTLFPSGTITKGLSGRVGMKISDNCNLTGTGKLTLHINTTNTKIVTPAASYCEDRSTLEPISGISTEEACHAANVNGRWHGYGDSFCESTTTLERLDYNESACAGHGGTWTSGGSPFKYAIYDNAEGTGTPLSKGKITSANLGNDVDIYTNIAINRTQKYYYIFIWLDGYLTDGTYTELPFSGYIKASAEQDHAT